VSAFVIQSEYVPREHVLDFHARKERFAVMVFHRRAGKTVACINDLIDKAVQCKLPFPRYGYVAPLYKQAKDVAWTYLKHYAGELIDKIMESELTVILKTGAIIRLYGADNPDSLRGVYFDGIILDEFGDMSPRLFGEVIAPTLADRKGWVAFIGTPKGENHFHELWQDAQFNEHWYTKMLRADESGIIDADELALLRNMPGSDDDTFRQEFLCDFTAANRGAFYAKQINELAANQGIFLHDPNKPVFTAWDIGYSDDTSIWFWQQNGKELAVIDFYTISGHSLEQVLSFLRTKPYAYGTMHLPHDAFSKSFQTGKSVEEQLRAAGCKVRRVPSLSVMDGIQAVRATLPDMYFNTSNPDVRVGLNALKTYQRVWDDRNRRFKDEPKHDWSSNPADAARMMALSVGRVFAKQNGEVKLKTMREDKLAKPLNLVNLFADNESKVRTRRI
jgi:phage terminase large subunit